MEASAAASVEGKAAYGGGDLCETPRAEERREVPCHFSCPATDGSPETSAVSSEWGSRRRSGEAKEEKEEEKEVDSCNNCRAGVVLKCKLEKDGDGGSDEEECEWWW